MVFMVASPSDRSFEILQDGSKTKRSTAEVQVGFLSFVAHSAHQILGHVQAAQLRAVAVSMDGAVKFVKIPWGFRWYNSGIWGILGI